MEVIQRFESAALYFTLASYLLATLFNWADVFKKSALFKKFSLALTMFGLIGNTILLALRIVVKFNDSGLVIEQYKFLNTYEFLLAFTWFTVLLTLLLIQRDQVKVCGTFIMPIILVLFVYVLLVEAGTTTDLSRFPIFRSNWLTGYMLTSALSYSAFAISFGLGIMYLLKDYLNKTNPRGTFTQYLPGLDALDQLGYRFVSHGFPFFTISIVLGAIWANNAWGRFWSWEPKETWSFISWLAYIAYLHARLLYGWRGNRSAWMAVMGFLAVLFTFIGVNYFLPGQTIFIR